MKEHRSQELSRKIVLYSFGCQMNKLDSELVLGRFQERGYRVVGDPSEADLVLFNTCSVRAHAEEKVYSRLGVLKKVKEERPSLIIAVMGCMAQKEGERILKRSPHVDLVCGTFDGIDLPDRVEEFLLKKKPLVRTSGRAVPYPERNPKVRLQKHSAFVSAMRGCNNRCTYCVVPNVRGEERSRPIPEVVEEVRRLAEDGCVEVILLGQNIDSYGRSFGNPDQLPELLAGVSEVPGIRRIRFLTSHPKDMTSRLIEAAAKLPKVCEYVHLPAQSGSDRILRRMGRGYSSGRYRELVQELREKVPGVEIASDFIVGFPGEGEKDFMESCALVEDLSFQNIFVFKYSPREGTPAARMNDDVPLEEKKKRNQMLLSLQEIQSLEIHRRLIGKRVEVLVDGPSKRDPRRYTGRSRGNHIVVFPKEGAIPGQFMDVELSGVTPLVLYGEKTFLKQGDPLGREAYPPRTERKE